MKNIFDVIIVGGGPAGLSASLILARCLRKIIVFDTHKPRNRFSEKMHGYLSRDGYNPNDFLEEGRKDLLKYGVEIIDAEIIHSTSGELMEVVDEFSNVYYGRKLLIATGLVDTLPPLEGIGPLYGKSVHHCPYCDGYESRNKAIGIYGFGKSGAGMADLLSNWSDDVILLTDGKKITKWDHDRLQVHGIKVDYRRIRRLEGSDGELHGVIFKDGSFLERDKLFFTSSKYQRSHIAEQLNCGFTRKGVVKTDRFQQTNIPGVYVAGDACRDVQLVINAAAEGAKAAVIINKALESEKFEPVI
jgi:thioredoxin reductase